MLVAAGAAVSIEGDDLLVQGSGGAVPGGATITTHMDHRLAMSALVLGLATGAPGRRGRFGLHRDELPRLRGSDARPGR